MTCLPQELLDIADTSSVSLAKVAMAVDSLSNREAWRSITQWVRRRVPKRPGAWRDTTQAIWAERKRLRRRKRTATHQQRLG